LEELAADVIPLLDCPFVLFGHSFGAIVALDLAHEILARTGLEPLALVVSGSGPPGSAAVRGVPLHLRSDRELIAELRLMGGTLSDVLESEDLMALFLPLVRVDSEMLALRSPGPRLNLKCTVLSVAGTDDANITDAAMNKWRRVTNGAFEARRFPGGHFYEYSGGAALMNFVALRSLRLAAAANAHQMSAEAP